MHEDILRLALDCVQFLFLASESRNHYAFDAHVLNLMDIIKTI